jgi:hypothetical protein
MTVTQQDFTMWAGTTKKLEFAIAGALGVEDIQDATWTMGQLTKSLADGITIEPDSGGGIFAVVGLEPKDTEEHNECFRTSLAHQLVIEDTYGHLSTAAEGTATIHQTLGQIDSGS